MHFHIQSDLYCVDGALDFTHSLTVMHLTVYFME